MIVKKLIQKFLGKIFLQHSGDEDFTASVAQLPQLVYLDFDGAKTSYNGTLASIDNVNVNSVNFSENEINYAVMQLNKKYAGEVIFVSQAPKSGKYSTVFVGATDAFSSYGNFRGIAETIDTGNQIKNDNAFVITNSDSSIDNIIGDIAHEVDHIVLGLDHGGDGISAYALNERLTLSTGQSISGITIGENLQYKYIDIVGGSLYSVTAQNWGEINLVSGTLDGVNLQWANLILSGSNIAASNISINGGGLFIRSSNTVTITNLSISSGSTIYADSGLGILLGNISLAGKINTSNGGMIKFGDNANVAFNYDVWGYIKDGIILDYSKVSVGNNVKFSINTQANLETGDYIIAANAGTFNTSTNFTLTANGANLGTMTFAGGVAYYNNRCYSITLSGNTLKMNVAFKYHWVTLYKNDIQQNLPVESFANATISSSSDYSRARVGVDGVMTNISIKSGGTVEVHKGGRLINATLGGKGTIEMHGGTMTGGTVNADVNGKGLVVFAKNDNDSRASDVLLNGGDMVVEGGQVNNITTQNGSNITIYGGAKATNITAYAGGEIYVKNGGELRNAVVNEDGKFGIYGGGKAYDVTLDRGVVAIYNGAQLLGVTKLAGELRTWIESSGSDTAYIEHLEFIKNSTNPAYILNDPGVHLSLGNYAHTFNGETFQVSMVVNDKGTFRFRNGNEVGTATVTLSGTVINESTGTFELLNYGLFTCSAASETSTDSKYSSFINAGSGAIKIDNKSTGEMKFDSVRNTGSGGIIIDNLNQITMEGRLISTEDMPLHTVALLNAGAGDITITNDKLMTMNGGIHAKATATGNIIVTNNDTLYIKSYGVGTDNKPDTNDIRASIINFGAGAIEITNTGKLETYGIRNDGGSKINILNSKNFTISARRMSDNPAGNEYQNFQWQSAGFASKAEWEFYRDRMIDYAKSEYVAITNIGKHEVMAGRESTLDITNKAGSLLSMNGGIFSISTGNVTINNGGIVHIGNSGEFAKAAIYNDLSGNISLLGDNNINGAYVINGGIVNLSDTGNINIGGVSYDRTTKQITSSGHYTLSTITGNIINAGKGEILIGLASGSRIYADEVSAGTAGTVVIHMIGDSIVYGNLSAGQDIKVEGGRIVGVTYGTGAISTAISLSNTSVGSLIGSKNSISGGVTITSSNVTINDEVFAGTVNGNRSIREVVKVNCIKTIFYKEIYGGSFNGGSVGASEINIQDSTIKGDIFGGGSNASVIGNAALGIYGNVSISLSDVTMANNGKVLRILGAGDGVSVSGDVTLSISAKTSLAGDIYGGGTNSRVAGNIELGIYNSNITGIIYGGGVNSTITGNVMLGITDSTEIAGNIYGGASDGDVAGTINMNISNATTNGLIFGGAATAANSVGSVNIIIGNETAGLGRTSDTTFVNKTIYGGGYGSVGNASGDTNNVVIQATVYSGSIYSLVAGAISTSASVSTSVYGSIKTDIYGGLFQSASNSSKFLTGGSRVAAGKVNSNVVHTVTGNIKLNILGAATFTNQLNIYAGGYVTCATANIGDRTQPDYVVKGNVFLYWSKASFQNPINGYGIFLGAFTSSKSYAVIEGNAFAVFDVGNYKISNVHGGGWSQTGGKSEIGDVNITVNGGEFNYILGGGVSCLEDGSTKTGAVNITINNGIIDSIYGGGYYAANDIVSSTVITINNGSAVKTLISGEARVGSYASEISSTLNLNFKGAISAAIKNFDTITFGNGSVVTFTNPAQKLDEIKNWDFDITTLSQDEAMLYWQSGSNNFALDSLALHFDNLTGANSWTLIDSNIDLSKGWAYEEGVSGFRSVVVNGNFNLTWDGKDSYIYMAGNEYWKLFLDDNNTNLVLAKLA